MKVWVEKLESRAFLSSSAYPVVAGDAGVLADNQHLTNDKNVLASDTSSFKVLVANDKAALKATVPQDRSAVKADKAVVKADANDPTLLGPAQTALENAVIELSGDTASLKTRLSVDSADQRSTLHVDNQAIRTDEGFLRQDTKAAAVALKTNIMRIASDIAAIQARGSASPAVVSTLGADLTAAARGQTKPGAAAVSAFAASLATALNSGGLSAKQEAALAQDLVDVVNSGGVAAAQTEGVMTSAGALLSDGGASPADSQAAIAALGGMIVS
jgi:hypothetical protein